MKYFYFVLTGGVELSPVGPFASEEVRDLEARKEWKDLSPDHGDNIFPGSMDESGQLFIGVYVDGDLDEEE